MPTRKRYRWECPNGCPGVLGSSRPRKDDVVRYCLKCSAHTGRLVERTAPALDKQRAARLEQRAQTALRKAHKDRAKRTAYFTVDGVNMHEALCEAWRLPTVQELRHRNHVYTDVPKLEVKRCKDSWYRRRWGTAYIGRHKIVLYIRPDHGTAKEVLDTLLHEVAHLVTPRHHHDHVFRAAFKSIKEEAREAGILS
jgi:hypothetical protein